MLNNFFDNAGRNRLMENTGEIGHRGGQRTDDERAIEVAKRAGKSAAREAVGTGAHDVPLDTRYEWWRETTGEISGVAETELQAAFEAGYQDQLHRRESRHVQTTEKKPKLQKPSAGHESPHPYQGRMVGESDGEFDINTLIPQIRQSAVQHAQAGRKLSSPAQSFQKKWSMLDDAGAEWAADIYQQAHAQAKSDSASDDHDAWREKTAAKRQGRHYHESADADRFPKKKVFKHDGNTFYKRYAEQEYADLIDKITDPADRKQFIKLMQAVFDAEDIIDNPRKLKSLRKNTARERSIDMKKAVRIANRYVPGSWPEESAVNESVDLDEVIGKRGKPDPFASKEENDFAYAFAVDDLDTMKRLYKNGLNYTFKVHNTLYRPKAVINQVAKTLKKNESDAQKASRYHPDSKTYRGSRNKMPHLDDGDPVNTAGSLDDMQDHEKEYDPISGVEHGMDQERIGSHLRKVLDGLRDHEREVMTLRYGLDGGEEHSLEDTGKILGLTREQVRRIEGRAISKMRHPTRTAPLRGYVDDDDIEAVGGGLSIWESYAQNARKFLPVEAIDDGWALDGSYAGDVFELSNDDLHQIEQTKVPFQVWSNLFDRYDTRGAYITKSPKWPSPMISLAELERLGVLNQSGHMMESRSTNIIGLIGSKGIGSLPQVEKIIDIRGQIDGMSALIRTTDGNAYEVQIRQAADTQHPELQRFTESAGEFDMESLPWVSAGRLDSDKRYKLDDLVSGLGGPGHSHTIQDNLWSEVVKFPDSYDPVQDQIEDAFRAHAPDLLSKPSQWHQTRVNGERFLFVMDRNYHPAYIFRLTDQMSEGTGERVEPTELTPMQQFQLVNDHLGFRVYSGVKLFRNNPKAITKFTSQFTDQEVQAAIQRLFQMHGSEPAMMESTLMELTGYANVKELEAQYRNDIEKDRGKIVDEKFHRFMLRYQILKPFKQELKKHKRGIELSYQGIVKKDGEKIFQAEASSPEAVKKELIDHIMKINVGKDLPDSGSVTLFLNVEVATDVVGHGEEFYVNVQNVNGVPAVIIQNDPTPGFYRATDRTKLADRDNPGRNSLPAASVPARVAKAAGMKFARYRLGDEISVPGGTGFLLVHDSDVADKSEKRRMYAPGVTVSPTKPTTEARSDSMKRKMNKAFWWDGHSDPADMMRRIRNYTDQELISLVNDGIDDHQPGGDGTPRAAQIKLIKRELKRRFGVSPRGDLKDIAEQMSELGIAQAALPEGRVKTAAAGLAMAAALWGATEMSSAKHTPLGQALQQAAQQGDQEAAQHLKKLDLYTEAGDLRTLEQLRDKYMQ